MILLTITQITVYYILAIAPVAVTRRESITVAQTVITVRFRPYHLEEKKKKTIIHHTIHVMLLVEQRESTTHYNLLSTILIR
jgi:hypothetical protein